MDNCRCNYCGKAVYNRHKFIIPTKYYISYPDYKNPVTTIIEPTEQFICRKCQDDIAELLNLLNYGDINIKEIKQLVYDKFEEECLKIVEKEEKIENYTII